MAYELKDSGERREFKSGAVRDRQEGKGRFDLLPFLALKRLAQHFEAGAIKYTERNWEKGISISSFMDSALRHLSEFIVGKDDEPHLVAALWNISCAIETIERIKLGILPPELDDLPYILRKIKGGGKDVNEGSG